LIKTRNHDKGGQVQNVETHSKKTEDLLGGAEGVILGASCVKKGGGLTGGTTCRYSRKTTQNRGNGKTIGLRAVV